MDPETNSPGKLEEFIDELRRSNELFRQLKKETVLAMFRLSEIAIYNNEIVYVKGDKTSSALLIIFGKVALFSKETGQFCECGPDESLAEENVLLEKTVSRYYLFLGF